MRVLKIIFSFWLIQVCIFESDSVFCSEVEQEMGNLFFWGIGGTEESSRVSSEDLSFSKETVNLEDMAQDFVVSSKKITIPEYPYAFNPSIVRWRGRLLLSFRVIPDRKNSFTSLIGLVWLDEEFAPISPSQILHTRSLDSEVPSRAEDARLLTVGDKLLIVYSDNEEARISKGGFRMYVGELVYEKGEFYLEKSQKLSFFEGESRNVREKNWVPFDVGGGLFFSYSLTPHRVFFPILDSGVCQTISSSCSECFWKWGELRGGTPALKLDQEEYLAFFHSSVSLATIHSEGKKIRHYFMGAYTFSTHYPYQLLRMSPKPIIGKGFYSGENYKPYWKPVRVVFPGGYLLDKKSIWVVFGKQDHEIWVAKIDRKKLLDSLIPL